MSCRWAGWDGGERFPERGLTMPIEGGFAGAGEDDGAAGLGEHVYQVITRMLLCMHIASDA